MVSWYGITPGENAVKIVKMATEDLEYDRNLVDKNSSIVLEDWLSFDRSSALGKMLSNSVVCYREIVCGKKESIDMYGDFIVGLF